MSSAQNQADGAADGGDTVSFGVMLAVVLVLFLVVVFVFFFYLYAKRRMGRSSSLRSYSRTRFGLASGHVAPHPGGGLDAAVLSSLPVTVYRAAKYKEGVECAVCLTELSDGEKARLLPMCNHGFHLACIDMWFRSHATCPLCRAPVASQPAGVQGSDGPAESAQAPNTSETVPESLSIPSGVISPRQGPSGYAGSSVPETPAGAIVIEIQSREPEGTLSPLPPSRPAREEAKTPALSSLKSLTRILSRGKPVAGPSLSPTAADIEQGYRESAPTPKALNHPRGRPWQNWLRRAYIS